MLIRLAVVAVLTAALVAVVIGRGRAAAVAVTLPDPVVDERAEGARGSRSIVLAGGCFWGVEAIFEHTKGVTSAVSGYAGGPERLARYGAVSAGGTGHAESVKVTYDPKRVSLGTLLKVFFSVAHDPTQLNRQGADVGPQYRSAIFFATEEQRMVAQAYLDALASSKAFPRPIVTELTPLVAFYEAEEEHQDFAEKHPFDRYIVLVDKPKIDEFSRVFPALYE